MRRETAPESCRGGERLGQLSGRVVRESPVSGQASGVGDGFGLVGGRDGASARADQDAALGHGRAQGGSPRAYDRRLAVTRGRKRLAAAVAAVAAAKKCQEAAVS